MDRVHAGFRIAAGLALFAFVSGCGGGGSTSGGADPSLSFAVTDAASDDIASFTVEITDIKLTKLGGTLVGILSTPTTVDLASLTDFSQIISGKVIPAGTYVAASITIDFTNAHCFLNGNTTEAAIQDEAGNPLNGPITLPISLVNHPLLCPFNRHVLLEYDFDLNQSCATDTVANTVSIDPAFVLHVDPAAPKPLLVTGTVTSVDSAMHTFLGQMRTLGGTALTPVTITCNNQTIFQIDGVPSSGFTGLANLATVPTPDVTWFEVLATINSVTQAINASVVYAGHGTYNGGDDIIEGHIVDRSGAPGTDATLTVKGHSNESNHTVFQFDQTFTVSTSFANTKIVRTGINQAFGTDDLNVGQRVRIFGAVTGTNMDASTTSSVARMQFTSVFGHANSAPALGDLEIDLTRVDLRPQADFTWASSGTPPTDPAHFVELVGNLGNGLGIAATTPVAAVGFFPAITDTQEDFQATVLANLNTVPSLLFVRNRPAGLTVDATALPGSVSLQISGVAVAGEVAVIDQPFVGSSALPTAPDPTIVPDVRNVPKFFVIKDKALDTTTVYTVFSDFTAALEQKLGVGAVVDQVAAIGVYASGNNRITATLASAIVH